MRVFLDSSALAKRYIEEKGSERVCEAWDEAEDITLSILCIPEVLSACNRLRRDNRLDPLGYRKIKERFLDDLRDTHLIDVVPSVIETAVRCLEKGTARTLDTIHVASAASIGIDLFITSDSRQAESARAMKLRVEIV